MEDFITFVVLLLLFGCAAVAALGVATLLVLGIVAAVAAGVLWVPVVTGVLLTVVGAFAIAAQVF